MNFFLIIVFSLVATLPALVWLIFFMREDIHPEPRRLIAYSFFIGALATAPALLVQLGLKHFLSGNAPVWSFLLFALTEEIFKFLAAYYAVSKSPFFDEPIDAMIYMIAVAAGFATVENVLITLSSLNELTAFSVINTTNVVLLRFIGATLLHVLSSSIVGYAWSKSVAEETHFGFIVKGLVFATLIHTIFNYIISSQSSNNLLYSSTILIFASFFVLNDFEILKRSDKKSAM